jgi:hypothetical protein
MSLRHGRDTNIPRKWFENVDIEVRASHYWMCKVCADEQVLTINPPWVSGNDEAVCLRCGTLCTAKKGRGVGHPGGKREKKNGLILTLVAVPIAKSWKEADAWVCGSEIVRESEVMYTVNETKEEKCTECKSSREDVGIGILYVKD